MAIKVRNKQIAIVQSTMLGESGGINQHIIKRDNWCTSLQSLYTCAMCIMAIACGSFTKKDAGGEKGSMDGLSLFTGLDYWNGILD